MAAHMIQEVQHYRASFAHMLVWLTAATFPLFGVLYYLSLGDAFTWKGLFDSYQLPAGINILASGTAALFMKFSLLPRGISGLSPGFRQRYVPFSGILEAQGVNLLGLRFIRMKNEAEQVVFLPVFIGKQREFFALLDGLLPEGHVMRECFVPPPALVD